MIVLKQLILRTSDISQISSSNSQWIEKTAMMVNIILCMKQYSQNMILKKVTFEKRLII